jgi:C-terminal processing protease CtpA/Prc
MLKRKKTVELTTEEQLKKLKRDNIRFQIEILVMLILLLALFFFNYNYTVFKMLIAGNYVYTSTLDDIYSEELGVDTNNNYYKDFDNVAISLFTNKLYEKNEDYFTMLFRRGELAAEQEEMDADAAQTSFEAIDDDTLLFNLTTFSSPALKITKANEDKMRDCKYLIIDLRDNPGGVLKCADKIAEMFLPEGDTIAEYKYRSKLLSSTVKSKNKSPIVPEHIYILQDEYTASAAEVLINALKDNLDNVTVVGTTSYGKGIGQTEMKLLNGYGVKATTLEIFTPNGDCINHIGIKPDKVVDGNALEFVKNEIVN